MSAHEALIAYGYVRTGEFYAKGGAVPTDAWQRAETGWLCYRPAERPLGAIDGENPAAGAAWGRPVAGLEGWVQVPHRQAPGKWSGVSGLHPLTHPEAFEWEWPEARVEEIYANGNTAGPNPWRRDSATGELVRVPGR